MSQTRVYFSDVSIAYQVHPPFSYCNIIQAHLDPFISLKCQASSFVCSTYYEIPLTRQGLFDLFIAIVSPVPSDNFSYRDLEVVLHTCMQV